MLPSSPGSGGPSGARSLPGHASIVLMIHLTFTFHLQSISASDLPIPPVKSRPFVRRLHGLSRQPDRFPKLAKCFRQPR